MGPPPPPPALAVSTTQPAPLNSFNLNQHNLNLTQQHIAGALFNKNTEEPTYGIVQHPKKDYHKRLGVVAASTSATTTTTSNNDDLHMAEKLVECAALQQKSAFQFDTITPKKNRYENTNVTEDEEPQTNSCLTTEPKDWLRNGKYCIDLLN